MAEKLKIISLGGLNEIGKNLTVYEYGGDMIVVDVGMGFPDDDMYGIDVVIPDFTYLIQNRDRIRAIFITHGHEDHIGGIPYLMRDINAPIYATRMSAGLIRLKLEEHRLTDKVKLVTCEAGDTVKAGKFSVEFIHVNHSIADAVAFAIKCPVGVCVHTGDFKIDMFNTFEKATGVKLNYQIVGRRAGDIEKVWANPDFANKELGVCSMTEPRPTRFTPMSYPSILS